MALPSLGVLDQAARRAAGTAGRVKCEGKDKEHWVRWPSCDWSKAADFAVRPAARRRQA